MDNRDIGIERLPRPRDSVTGDNSTRKRRHRRSELVRQLSENSTTREFFVPSFAVRRAVLITPEVINLNAALNDKLDTRTYEVNPVDRLAMSILEQSRFRRVFLDADVQPAAEEVEQTALTIKDGLRSLLKSKPHKLKMPLGPAHVFGLDNKSIGVVPLGWKGFGTRYPRKVDKGVYGANSQIVSETNLAIGAISNVFLDGIDSDGEYSEVDVRPLSAGTPHVTIARKIRGPSITNSERAEIGGKISEIIAETCPEFDLFDPVIHLRLDNGHRDRFMPGLEREYPTTMFARRPKFREYGPQLPEALTSLT